MTRPPPALAVVAMLTLAAPLTAGAAPTTVRSVSDILNAAPAADWRSLDPQRTVYFDLSAGRVIVELAPDFAPNHAANIALLVRSGFFDGASVMRSQDNYVVQWGGADDKAPTGGAKAQLTAEFETRDVAALGFQKLDNPDAYAPQVGFAKGFPAARDPATGKVWLVHCYGMVGVARDEGADTGNGGQLYAPNGQAPRQLDRNLTVVGRVVQGMELLSTLPRGTGPLGFYQTEAEKTPILKARIAADLPEAERSPLQALRTDSASFQALLESRRNRREAFFKFPAGRIDVCNAPLPVRAAPKSP